jgi:hypothetical protein
MRTALVLDALEQRCGPAAAKARASTSRPIARAHAAPQAARCPASPGASVADSVTGLAGDTREHDAHRFCTASRRNGADAVPKRLICAR